MTKYNIFIIDDEEHVRQGISLALRKKYEIQCFADGESALEVLSRQNNKIPDLILLDVGLPGISGIEVLQKIKTDYPQVLVLMITAYEDVQTVISAMKLGARDYLVKPLQMEGVLRAIDNALESVRLRKEVQTLQAKALQEQMPCFIAQSQATTDVISLVKRVAQSPDTPILVLGQTGTGKELIAGAIHFRSPNFAGPLITLNCAAIPENLVESELFGYVRGAFSGADKNKEGLVAQAHGGTLFLDEVGDLSLDAQAKLLRFLEQGEFYPLGSTRRKKVKTRIVSATNRNLEQLIEQGKFRRDLYYRLAVVRIEVPTLNERREDILPIANSFVVEFSQKFNKQIQAISDEAGQTLKNHHWQGNIRELRNVMERACLLTTKNHIEVNDLCLPEVCKQPPQATNSLLPKFDQQGINLPAIQEKIEKYYFEQAMQTCEGNESKAAKMLGLSRDSFRYRKKKLIR